MIIFRSGLSIVVSKQQNSLLTPIYSKKKYRKGWKQTALYDCWLILLSQLVGKQETGAEAKFFVISQIFIAKWTYLESWLLWSLKDFRRDVFKSSGRSMSSEWVSWVMSSHYLPCSRETLNVKWHLFAHRAKRSASSSTLIFDLWYLWQIANGQVYRHA